MSIKKYVKSLVKSIVSYINKYDDYDMIEKRFLINDMIKYNDGVLDINTSRVIYKLDNYFSYNSNIKKVVNLDTSKAIILNSLFYKCCSLTSICNLDLKSCTDLDFSFSYTSIDESPILFNTHNLKSMVATFSDCTSLKRVHYMDTKNVKNFRFTFFGCTNLKHIDWEIDMSSCEGVTGMFKYCDELKQVTLKNVPIVLKNDIETEWIIGISKDKIIVKNYID